MNVISYLVLLRVKEGLREWTYNTVVSIIEPPTDHDDLKTVIEMKCISQNPSATEIEIISFQEVKP